MTRFRLLASVVLGALVMTGCGSVFGPTTDNTGRHYARLRGTVTRASGAAVANAPVGISCVGSNAEPFGLTVDADANGAFQTDVYAASIFPPLPGPSYTCRVLTPYTGIPLAERTVTVAASPDFPSRPTTTVTLVLP